jgi:DNA-binding SARP family transcriptional activator
MFKLICFGGLRLDCTNGLLPGPVLRARSLALLAFLASRREQGMSREKVLGYFWPDYDTDHARNNLKQTLFGIRRSLGDQDAISSGPFLRVDPSRLLVDAWRFEDALDRRSPVGAIAHYSGPFLDGLYISGLPAFGEWVEAERVRLARRYQEALETLAAEAAAGGDTHGAVAWWRRVVEHDPLSSRVALALMRALIADGDRVGALEYAELHESLLRAELGVEPDTGEKTFVTQLRQVAFRNGYRSLRPRMKRRQGDRPSSPAG